MDQINRISWVMQSFIHAYKMVKPIYWVGTGFFAIFILLLALLVGASKQLASTSGSFSIELPNSQAQSDLSDEDMLLVKVTPGDNLSYLFTKANLGPDTITELTRTSNGKKLGQLHPGDTLAFQLNDQGALERLEIRKSPLEAWVFKREKNEFISEQILKEPEIFHTFAHGTIKDSLFMAGTEAGLDQGTIMDLAAIFGWDIDFVLDIRAGDSFSLIYEEKFLDGEKLGDGNILVARFSNRGKEYTAVRYNDGKGLEHYFTPDGFSMRKEFIRSPVDFARISSKFNLRRKHPILHKIRAHRGVDYAARRGTPVKAAGDGKVIHAARKGGFGNAVILQHGSRYTTLYAHLHKFGRGIRKGRTVKQGQIIGYVGSTGLASGPHLHYEFRVNGVHRNPLTVKLPKAQPIDGKRRQEFRDYANIMVLQLEGYLQERQIAAL